LIGRQREVRGELAYGVQVGLLRACAQAGELQVLAHAFAQGRSPGRGHDWLLSQRERTRTTAKDAAYFTCPGYARTRADDTINVETIVTTLHCRVAAYLNDLLKLTRRLC
jgi:hypothetical protein